MYSRPHLAGHVCRAPNVQGLPHGACRPQAPPPGTRCPMCPGCRCSPGSRTGPRYRGSVLPARGPPRPRDPACTGLRPVGAATHNDGDIGAAVDEHGGFRCCPDLPRRPDVASLSNRASAGPRRGARHPGPGAAIYGAYARGRSTPGGGWAAARDSSAPSGLTGPPAVPGCPVRSGGTAAGSGGPGGADCLQAGPVPGGTPGRANRRCEPGRMNEADLVKVNYQRAAGWPPARKGARVAG